MSLIDYTYFNGVTFIKDITGSTPAELAARAKVVDYINTAEPELLYLVFGKTLYDALILGLEAETPDVKWTTLRDKLIDSTNKKSFIANYVWVKIAQQSFVDRDADGNIISNIGATTKKVVDIWNMMLPLITTLAEWLDTTTDYDAYNPYFAFPMDKMNVMGL